METYKPSFGHGAVPLYTKPGEHLVWLASTVLQHCQRAITSVGNEHVTRGVRERQWRLGLHHDCLGCDSASPKHRHLSLPYRDSNGDVGMVHITNAKDGRVTHVDRGAVDRWEAAGDLYDAHDVVRGDGTHTHDQRTMEYTGGLARAISDSHVKV